MSAIHNERTKLTANALNTAATSCFAVGVLAPVAASFYNVGQGAVPIRWIAVGVALWLSVALFLHYLARRHLGGLRL